MVTMERLMQAEVPDSQSTLRQVMGDYTPVFTRGDWVEWDPKRWEPLVEGTMLWPQNQDGQIGAPLPLVRHLRRTNGGVVQFSSVK